MLMNFKEFTDYLDKKVPYWDFIEKEDVKERYLRNQVPYKYDCIVEEQIGRAYVWNDVGSIEMSVIMYKPIGGGTVLYDVN